MDFLVGLHQEDAIMLHTLYANSLKRQRTSSATLNPINRSSTW